MANIKVINKQDALNVVEIAIRAESNPNAQVALQAVYQSLMNLAMPQKPKTQERRKDAYDRKGVYSIEAVHSKIQDDYREDPEGVDFDGDMIHMDSLRYKCFRRQICCVRCGLEGKFYAKERGVRRRDGMPVSNRYHFNLYGIGKDGNEVIFTKDHIKPRSKGGSDSLNNLQTMCGPCNWKKGNKHE